MRYKKEKYTDTISGEKLIKMTERYNNGDIKLITYRLDSNKKRKKFHRIDGPARVEYKINNVIVSKCWYKNGIPHNDYGPAAIHYYEGILHRTHYLLNGHTATNSEIEEIEFKRLIMEGANESSRNKK